MLLLVAGAALAAVLLPLFSAREPWDLEEAPDRLRHLKRSRAHLLRALKDLENDYREGALLEPDYNEIRAQYKGRAIEVSKELDRVREALLRRMAAGPSGALTDAERQAIEAEVARRKKKPPAGKADR
jgi:hypothetical protein